MAVLLQRIAKLERKVLRLQRQLRESRRSTEHWKRRALQRENLGRATPKWAKRRAA